MAENEALESALKKIIAQEKSNWGYIENFDVDENWAVRTAIEEVQQYRQIGTVEECREAVEKQTAKKVKSISPVKDGDSYVCLIGRCPCCGDILEENTVYCDCGQRLDWEGE